MFSDLFYTSYKLGKTLCLNAKLIFCLFSMQMYCIIVWIPLKEKYLKRNLSIWILWHQFLYSTNWRIVNRVFYWRFWLENWHAFVDIFWQPDHGSLLQYGGLFRYTPYKGFFGKDSFNYTISDLNGNLATGAAHISVLSLPPQFVSFPSQLQAVEDMISPRFG